MRKRYRIVNKARFSIFITLVFIILIFLVSLIPSNKVHSSIHKIEYRNVYVSRGDTLWNIALKYLPKDTDVRRLIYDIKEFNQMDSSYIYPGDTIKIPISKY